MDAIGFFLVVVLIFLAIFAYYTRPERKRKSYDDMKDDHNKLYDNYKDEQ